MPTVSERVDVDAGQPSKSSTTQHVPRCAAAVTAADRLCTYKQLIGDIVSEGTAANVLV